MWGLGSSRSGAADWGKRNIFLAPRGGRRENGKENPLEKKRQTNGPGKGAIDVTYPG